MSEGGGTRGQQPSEGNSQAAEATPGGQEPGGKSHSKEARGRFKTSHSVPIYPNVNIMIMSRRGRFSKVLHHHHEKKRYIKNWGHVSLHT